MIEQIVRPTVTEDGQRAPGLRFGDPRIMALFLAIPSSATRFRRKDAHDNSTHLLSFAFIKTENALDVRLVINAALGITG